MGIAAMVIGIVSAVLGFIPFCNYFALLPAGVGFILGTIDVVTKTSKNKKMEDGGVKLNIGQGVAGIVLNSVAILVIILWTFLFAVAQAVK